MELISIFIMGTYLLSAKCQESNENEFPSAPDFPKAVKCKYYVDKSLLLKTFFDEGYPTALVRAPKNFGKSLNLQMMKYFLEIQVEKNGSEIFNKSSTTNFGLFNNTQIYKEHPEFFKRHFGMYPVIYVDYGKLAEVGSYKEMLEAMKDVLRNTFVQHRYLIRVNSLWVEGLNILTFMKYVDDESNETLSEYAIENGLTFLSEVLYRHFDRRSIVLIDDYDSYVNGILFENNKDAHNIIHLFRSIHGPLLESSCEIIQNVFCTGIFYIPGGGLSPADKNLMDYSFLDGHRYSEYYGLTQDELTTLLKKYTDDKIETERLKTDIHQFYDGYTVLQMYNVYKETHIYNILSVLEYLQNKKLGHREPLQAYWARPTFYTLLLRLFYRVDIKNTLIELLQNETFTINKITYLSEDEVMFLKRIISVHFQNIEGAVRDLVFRFLLQLGYLTHTDNSFNQDRPYYILQLPNLEIKREVESMLLDSVVQQFGFEYDTIDQINNIMDGISKLNYQKTEFEKIFENFKNLVALSSDSVRRENDFQSTLIALFRKKFHENVTSELSLKHCRMDIHVLNKNGVSFIIETKLLTEEEQIEEKDMRKCTGEAINEIIKKGYINIIGHSFRERVVYMGICLGVTLFENGTTKNRLVGVSYSKNLDPADNINSTTIFVQKRFSK